MQKSLSNQQLAVILSLFCAWKAKISLPFITADASGPKHIEESLSRAKFEQLAGKLITRCRRFKWVGHLIGLGFEVLLLQSYRECNYLLGRLKFNLNFFPNA